MYPRQSRGEPRSSCRDEGKVFLLFLFGSKTTTITAVAVAVAKQEDDRRRGEGRARVLSCRKGREGPRTKGPKELAP